MHEMWMTNQTIAVEQIYGIDVALRAAYPDYVGLNYEGGRGLLRLAFEELPAEEVLIDVANIVLSAPAMGESVDFNTEVSTVWH